MCKYIKENYKGVKNIKDIEPKMIQSYINAKADSGCSNATVKQYLSRINKLSIISSNMIRSKINLSEGVKVPKMNNEKIRNRVMTEGDFKKIIATKSNSPAVIGVKLSYQLGLRVSEISKLRTSDCHSKVINIVDSKGGRSREIPIHTKEQKKVIAEFKAYCKEHNRNDLGIKADSINRWLNRRMNEVGIKTYIEAKTSVHSLRKAYAERTVTMIAKRDSCSYKDAWKKVSTYLGHGEQRTELFKVYCPNLQKGD